jgi:hypothetical protein
MNCLQKYQNLQCQQKKTPWLPTHMNILGRIDQDIKNHNRLGTITTITKV